MDEQSSPQRKAIIGNVGSSFWLYDNQTGFDLTHPPTPDSVPVSNPVRIKTSSSPITVDPAKSALVIIDMQNFFLSTALGNPPDSDGLKAQDELLRHAIPAARQAGIRVVWLNWGLTDDEIAQMPPAVVRVFGFQTVAGSEPTGHVKQKANRMSSANDDGRQIETLGKSQKKYVGLGNDMGVVTLEDGSVAEAGRMLMRHQWNTALTPELNDAFEQGQKSNPSDVWIHKNRMSGLWGASTACTEFLDKEGIRTLFFAGVNTDQCVGGSLTDAFTKGYDCILLKDGAATSSPKSCQEAYEYNAAGAYGFCLSCKDLLDGVKTQHK